MNERSAILLAGVAHLALLAALSLSWAMAAKTLPTFEEMTPVEVVRIDDVPKVTEAPKPSIEAAPQEAQEAAAPEVTPEPKPAPPPPEPPKPEPPKAVSDVPAPEAKPAPKAVTKTPEKPAPETKPEAKKVAAKPLDTQTLASLLDKKLPKAAKPLDTSKFADTIEKSLPKGAKIDARAAASLQAAIQAQVAPCWNPPIGGEDVRHMTVVLHIELSKDGRLSGTPSVIAQTGKTAGNDAYSRAFAESAKRAVARCSPLKLPAELYDAWRVFELNFDPSQMT